MKTIAQIESQIKALTADLEQLKNPQKWQPLPTDWVECSDDGEDWYGPKQYEVAKDYWKHYRPFIKTDLWIERDDEDDKPPKSWKGQVLIQYGYGNYNTDKVNNWLWSKPIKHKGTIKRWRPLSDDVEELRAVYHEELGL